MKFLHKDSNCINITDNIMLYEYCETKSNLAIDGAYALINGSYGPKTNKTFSELFFVISGKLEVEYNNSIHVLQAKDMLIVPPRTKHKIIGYECEAFISCSPQFDPNEVEFCA